MKNQLGKKQFNSLIRNIQNKIQNQIIKIKQHSKNSI